MSKIKIWFKAKWDNSLIGQGAKKLKSIYSKNKIAFAAEMTATYVLAGNITGIIGIWVYNLFGNGYSYDIPNIVQVWLFRGMLWSVLVWGMVQLLIFKGIMLFSSDVKRDERGYNLNKETPYGDADFMSDDVMKKSLIVAPIEENRGIIFGCHPKDDNLLIGKREASELRKINDNVFVVAGPGGGKSASYVISLVMQIIRRGESAIINDVKAELFKYLSELGKRAGYEVRMLNLNPKYLDNSDGFNFLESCIDTETSMTVSNAVIATASQVYVADFWTEGALNLLQAIILRIVTSKDYPQDKKTLTEVFNYLTQKSLEEIELDFANIRSGHLAYVPFQTFKEGKEEVKRQVLQGLRIKLKVFNSPKLRRVMSENKYGLSAANPGKKRCLYFIGSNARDSSMASMLALYYKLSFQALAALAETQLPDQRLPIPVHMVLDEFANMTPIPDFERELSTVRSYGIITHVICQDITQLDRNYPGNAWRTILNDIDYYILLKTNDDITAKWWQSLTGEQTKSITNVTFEKNKTDLFGIHDEERITHGSGQGAVMTVHQIETIGEDEELFYMSQRDTAILHTYYWKRHPYAKFVTDESLVLPIQHYPYWKLVEDGIVPPDFDYDHEPTILMPIPESEKIVVEEYDGDVALGIKKKPANTTSYKKKPNITDTVLQYTSKIKSVVNGVHNEHSEEIINEYQDESFDSSEIESNVAQEAQVIEPLDVKEKPEVNSNLLDDLMPATDDAPADVELSEETNDLEFESDFGDAFDDEDPEEEVQQTMASMFSAYGDDIGEI